MVPSLLQPPLFFLSQTEEPAKAGTCARDRHALQHLALNVHLKHSDLIVISNLIVTLLFLFQEVWPEMRSLTQDSPLSNWRRSGTWLLRYCSCFRECGPRCVHSHRTPRWATGAGLGPDCYVIVPVSGSVARDAFTHTGLPAEQLAQVWDLIVTLLFLFQEVWSEMRSLTQDSQQSNWRRSGTWLLRYCSCFRECGPRCVHSHRTPRRATGAGLGPDCYVIVPVSGGVARDAFTHTGLPAEQLAQVWDLADVNRDGRLDPDEFNIACHLIRMVKKGSTAGLLVYFEIQFI